MNDDTLSVASTQSISASNRPMDCPVCNNSLTLKHMFNHIRIKHQGYFFKSTTKNWLEDAQKGQPLKIMWEVKNDFDETDFVIIYGCLSTNKTFRDVSRALAHFKKDKDALKEHNKQIKEILKTRQRVIDKEKKEAAKAIAKDPVVVKFRELIEKNDPELRADLCAVLQNTISVCERLIEDSSDIMDMTTESPDHPGMRVQTVAETKDLFAKIKEDFARENNTVKYLRTMNQTLHRVICLRDVVSHYGKSNAVYAYYKTEGNPEGILTRGDSEFSEFF